jgi:hypothetical protein
VDLEKGSWGVDWVQLAQDRVQWSREYGNERSGCINGAEFFD